MVHRFNKLVLILTLLFCSACMPIDYKGDLINGYKIIKTNSISYAILYPGTTVLVPEEYITGINVKGNVIFGRIEPLTLEQQRFLKDKRHPGYFIVNTKNHSYRLGLSKEEWLSELKKVGIDQEPVLRRPSSFRNEPASITALKAIIFGQR